jgi:broad specificity phosphatase PhoE
MQIILLRHGATDWNLQGRCQGATDLDLNDTGLRQAAGVAAALSGETIAAIYSSNLKRAFQTAAIIGQTHNLAVVVEERLRELDHGELEGLTFAEVHSTMPDFFREWRERPGEVLIPGGERLTEVDARVWEGMSRIGRRHRPDETAVIVSHHFPIAAVLCRITGTSLNRYRSFRVAPCEATRLTYRDEAWAVLQAQGGAASTGA